MGAPRRRRRALLNTPIRPQGFSRRSFLQGMGGTAALALAAPVLSGCGDSERAGGLGASPGTPSPAPNPADPAKVSPFNHGVASGDPLSDRVILWTRATPVASEDIAVTVSVYRDTALTQLLGTATQTATAVRDWTIKIDFTGLAAATTYYYQFEALGFKTQVGRTRTAPASGADVSRLRFGLVSCSSYAHGFFNAYRFLAARADIDAVLHLGDYIYEYASDAASGDEVYGTVRPYEPTFEMKTLADYRTRHGYYKRTDPDLQEVHRQHPFITIWDDHESCDNSWRDGGLNHNENNASGTPKDEGAWPVRKAISQQAYDEWMPIRLPEPGNAARIWRKFSYGSLVDMILLDTRLFDRDLQLTTPITPNENPMAATRKLIGPVQMKFLTDALTQSTATWKLVGSQVVFHQWSLTPGLKAAGGPRGLNGDSWDAYGFERQQIIDAVRAGNVDNMVILTGDVHSCWIADITDDPNNLAAYAPDLATAEPRTYTGSVATEYVITSVTSPGLADLMGIEDGFAAANPQIKNIDFMGKGYAVLDVTPQGVTCDYWFVSTIAERGGSERFAFGYPTPVGENRIRAATTTATMVPAAPPPLAP